MKTTSPDGFLVEFPSSPSEFYQLYRSTDMTQWSPVGEAVSGAFGSATTTIEDPAPPAGRQFYQARRIDQ